MALPQPATTDDVITLGQLLDESFVQNTDKLNVTLMENLTALKTNNDLSKTVAESITKQQQTSERMAQAQERQADTAALAETESDREEARFKGNEKFSEKLADTLIPGLAGIRKQLEEQQKAAKERSNQGGLGNLLAGSAASKLIRLVLPLLSGLIPLALPLIIGGLGIAGGVAVFKGFFGEEAKKKEAEKDAGLAEGIVSDEDRVAEAEELAAKIAEAQEAGDDKLVEGLQAKFDNLILAQEQALKQTQDTVGLFRDKPEREAIQSSRGSLRKLRQMKKQAGQPVEPSAVPVSDFDEAEAQEAAMAEVAEPVPLPRPVEGVAEPMMEPEATAEPAATAEPVSEPAVDPSKLPDGVSLDYGSGKYNIVSRTVVGDEVKLYSSLHDTLEDALAYREEKEREADEFNAAIEAKQTAAFEEHLAGLKKKPKPTKDQKIARLKEEYAELQEIEAAAAAGDTSVRQEDIEYGRQQIMKEAEELGVDLEGGGSVETASSGTGERMGAMSEDQAADSGQPIIINNVKQGDTVTQTQINSSGGGAKDARPNAGSPQLG